MAKPATRVPKASWPMMATLVRSIFEQPDRRLYQCPTGRRSRPKSYARVAMHRRQPSQAPSGVHATTTKIIL